MANNFAYVRTASIFNNINANRNSYQWYIADNIWLDEIFRPDYLGNAEDFSSKLTCGSNIKNKATGKTITFVKSVGDIYHFIGGINFNKSFMINNYELMDR